MGRCHYDKLKSLEPALAQIRKLDLKEPKPGIFYLKSQGFLHFHEKDEKIWADVKDGANWGTPIDIPSKISRAFITDFVSEVRKRYLTSGGK